MVQIHIFENKFGNTALHYLIGIFNFDCVDEIKILLDHRIDINNFRIGDNSLLLHVSQKAPSEC